jgi:chromosome segregation ATPase
MTDQNAYINAYVDNSVGMLHEYVTMVLQLRTQLKIANDMVAEKDATISSLREQVSGVSTELQEELNKIKAELESYRSQVGDNNQLINQSRADAIKWEQEYNDMKNKMSHMDTLTSQMNEMKKMIIDKDNEIQDLKEKLTPKSPPKKVINTPKDKSETPLAMKEPEPDKNDDF